MGDEGNEGGKHDEGDEGDKSNEDDEGHEGHEGDEEYEGHEKIHYSTWSDGKMFGVSWLPGAYGWWPQGERFDEKQTWKSRQQEATPSIQKESLDVGRRQGKKGAQHHRLLCSWWDRSTRKSSVCEGQKSCGELRRSTLHMTLVHEECFISVN